MNVSSRIRRTTPARRPTALLLLALTLTACQPSLTPTDDSGVTDVDPDSDGIVTAHEGDADPDSDGLAAWQDPDSDGDGLPDRFEAGDEEPYTFPVDSDGDRTPDFLDRDSDDNGIADAQEGRRDRNQDGTPNHGDGDDDGDGVDDIHELANGAPIDTDGDGVPDHRDIDSDGDGIDDAFEAACSLAAGRLCDTDGDSTPDLHDLDSDNDGFTDAVEGSPGGMTPRDTDGDGLPDFRDLDSDGDRLSDAAERDLHGTDPTLSDTDGDGFADGVELDLGLDPLDPDSRGEGWMVEVPERTDREETLSFELGAQRLDVVLMYDQLSVAGDRQFLANTMDDLVSGLEGQVDDAAFGVVQLGGYCDIFNTGFERADFARLGRTCKTLWEDVPLQERDAFLADPKLELLGVQPFERWLRHTAPYEGFVQMLEGEGRDDDCDGTYQTEYDTLPWKASAADPFGGVAGGRADTYERAGSKGALGFRPYARPVFIWLQSVAYVDPGLNHPDRRHVSHRDVELPSFEEPPPSYPLFRKTPADCPSDADYVGAAKLLRKRNGFVLGLMSSDSAGSDISPEYSMRRFLTEIGNTIDLDGDGNKELPLLTMDRAQVERTGHLPGFTDTLKSVVTAVENTMAFDSVRIEIEGDDHGFIADISPRRQTGLRGGDRLATTVTFRGTVPALDHDQVFPLSLNVLTDDDDLVARRELLVVVPGRLAR